MLCYGFICSLPYQDVALLIADELHLLGGPEGPTLEVVVSRMRYISSQLEKKVSYPRITNVSVGGWRSIFVLPASPGSLTAFSRVSPAFCNVESRCCAACFLWGGRAVGKTGLACSLHQPHSTSTAVVLQMITTCGARVYVVVVVLFCFFFVLLQTKWFTKW